MTVAIGVLELHLFIPHSHSLKEKRAVVKRIVERVKNKFNVSVCEAGDQDKWQSSVIVCVSVGTSQKVVDATLEKVTKFVEEIAPGTLFKHYKEFI